MQKWEYLVMMIAADGWYANGVKAQGGPSIPMWDILKQKGAEGWELVTVDMSVAYMKRQRLV